MKKYALFVFCNLLFLTVINSLFAQEGGPPTTTEPTSQQSQIKQETLPPVPLVKQSQPITLSPTTLFPQSVPVTGQIPETPPPTTPPTTSAAAASAGVEQTEKKRPVVRKPREIVVLPSGEKSDLPRGWDEPVKLPPGGIRLEDITSPTLPETK